MNNIQLKVGKSFIFPGFFPYARSSHIFISFAGDLRLKQTVLCPKFAIDKTKTIWICKACHIFNSMCLPNAYILLCIQPCTWHHASLLWHYLNFSHVSQLTISILGNRSKVEVAAQTFLYFQA